MSGIRDGVVFVPMHYGYWDRNRPGPAGPGRAANELTTTKWDAVSKQPIFKTGVVKVEKVAAGSAPAPAPETTASAAVHDDGGTDQ